jgi:uncharacterized protein (TIGR00369 family)
MNAAAVQRWAQSIQEPHAMSASFTPADAQEILRTKLAPWIRDLDLVVESCSPAVVKLRLPFSTKLTRAGGTICSQALMACADSAMAIAIFAAFGEFRNVTTVSQTISFMRPIAAEDVTIEATVQKRGRNTVFCEVSLLMARTKAMAAHSTATWAVLEG